MSKANQKMSAVAFMSAVANAEIGVKVSGQAVDAIAQFIKESGLSDQIVVMELNPKTAMISSASDVALAALVEQAGKMKGVEVVHRLTLEAIQREIGQYYEVAEIVSVPDNRGREHEVLVTRQGDTVTVRSIIDPGIRKDARVLSIYLSPDKGGKWTVTGYEVTQYETSPDGSYKSGDQKYLKVESFSSQGKGSRFEQCREAIAMIKVTGGIGEDAWLVNRAQQLLRNSKCQNDADAADQAQSDLVQAMETFGRQLYAVTGTAMKVANDKFPIEQPKRRSGSYENRSRRPQQQEGFNTIGAQLAAALQK